MLSVIDIRKEYVTGDLKQIALDEINLTLRENEFVAILGPSGSGKTTLLNIIGGLDRYDSGDLIINGVSTKEYKDRDWDSYRNHSIGFVFQSYNLIPHQSILANVELALTISGVSKRERKHRATEALEKVGLGDQLHKRPSQLSGGQMQRVAIARALVNDPEVLLADEPTGALDTHTSVQIMALLKEVAEDRLVVMVTHNPELAEEYATRIIRLRDGKVVSDTNPCSSDKSGNANAEHRNLGKASMSFLTALSLSFNNLRTKKGRTFLTSFAGSIGIIGIALILSLSNGVNAYIGETQREAMASYPVTIEAQAIDLSSLIEAGRENVAAEPDHELDGIHSNSLGLENANAASTSVTTNNLTAFKAFLEDPANEVRDYVGDNGIVYSYPVDFSVYVRDEEDTLVNVDGSTFETPTSSSEPSSASPISSVRSSMMGAMGNSSPIPGGLSSLETSASTPFHELIPSADGDPVGKIVTDSYDLVAGQWPSSANDLVLILDENNEVPLSVLYQLGMLPAGQYRQILQDIEEGKDPEFGSYAWEYDEILGHQFHMLARSDFFSKNANGTFTEITDDLGIERLLEEKGRTLSITGVIRPSAASDDDPLAGNIGYTNQLTAELIDYTDSSGIVEAQKSTPTVNVLNGVAFSPQDDDAKVNETITYLKNLPVSEKAQLSSAMVTEAETAPAPYGVSEVELAASFDVYLDQAPDREMLLSIYDSQLSTGSYDSNLADFGAVSLDSPSSISIYADSFEDKNGITDAITAYNETVSTENQIVYTDYAGLLMSTVTTITNVISYVLVAFVAVSLLVSSIMIGIITFISVLERTKEIGVLRAIGASKRNISAVFNAETVIVGFLAGGIGIVITLVSLIPISALIQQVTGITTINASLPWLAGVGLVGLSVILTVVAGLFPARIAARKDPVAALRSE